MITSLNEFRKIQDSKPILEKTENQSYSYGCIMGYFDSPFDNPEIKEEDLYNNEENEYGLEIETHVTLNYGFHDEEIDENEVTKLLKQVKCPFVKAEEISLFENEKFDVVKWDVGSDELSVLNKMVCKMWPYTNKFPDYHAHVTIAYCKPGAGKTYATKLSEPIEKQISYWVYSKADGKKIKIDPKDGSVTTIREVNEQATAE